jgi:PD-(D/E)XK nuclease superfamily
MSEIYLKEECFKIIGLSMEVHKILGIGHSEVVYKREFEYKIAYKDIFLPS